MKKVVFLVLVLLFALLLQTISFGVEVPDDIRVGLFYGSSSKSSVTLSSPGGLEIGTIKNGKFSLAYKSKPSEDIKVIKSSNSKYAVKVGEFGVELGTEDEYPYFKSTEKDGVSIVIVEGKKYRGNIEIRRLAESDMSIVNHISMQEYLYGVVPREIGGASPIEAVKAQAIIARTYAAKNMGKRSGLGFDLYPTATDQAYGGYEWEHPNSNQAVDETYGEVATYNGELIGGNYFSTSGGYTENSENVWGSKVDYLRAVPDTYEPEIEGNTSWEVTMSANEVKSTLSKNGVNVGDIIDLVPTKFSDAGRVLELKVVGTNGEKIIEKDKVRTYLGLKSQWYTVNSEAPAVKTVGEAPVPSNEVTSTTNKEIPEKISIVEDEEIIKPKVEEEEIIVKVTDDTKLAKVDSKSNENDGEIIVLVDENGNTIITKGDKEQAIIIDNYIAEKAEQSKKVILNTILSFIQTAFRPSVGIKTYEEKALANTTKTAFTFRGRGWGHAVGMSQNGAKGMANNGFSAEEIIKWYYSGVSIEG